MIEAIMTGMTGRISNLHRVEPVRSVKQEEHEQEQAPKSLDNVSISSEAVELYNNKSVNNTSESENYTEDNKDPNQLSQEEEAEVKELKQRDQEVRQHEQAHKSAGGQYTSGPTYEYTNGPDNKRYATGGEVQIDTSEESTPEKTIEKAKIIKRSATAPAEPSAQDRRVAAEADRMEEKAKAELRQQKSGQSGQSSSNYGIQAYMQASAPTAGSMLNISL